MDDTRRFLLESVDDAAVVQLYADGFATLELRSKILVWHLYLAAIAGRDIYYDQRYAHNLEMRAVLEAILTHASHVEPRVLGEIRRYTKLFWINTGPYNNLTARKFVLRLTREELLAALTAARSDGALITTRPGETLAGLVDRLAPQFFDDDYQPVLTNKSPGNGRDILEASSNNLYAGVTMRALEGFHERYALNSRLSADNGRLFEEVMRTIAG
jgi:dipeptidyl-peptidase-3